MTETKTKTKTTDKAAQLKKASTDDQARAVGPLGIRDDVADTPTAAELDKAGIYGEDPDRQFQNRPLTADQMAVANGDKPVHKPKEVEGGTPAIGDRVIMTSATPIAGQTDSAAIIIGFSPLGNPNLRLEFTDGARSNPAQQEYGNIPYKVAQEERGSFWRWPSDFAAKKTNKVDAEK